MDYSRAAATLAGAAPDQRLAEVVEHVRSRQREEGRWPLDRTHAGPLWFELDAGPGRPSRWITLRALRVLCWWDG